MITADQLICHAIGDYVLQSDWMARDKTQRLWVAMVHAVAYSLPFLALRPSWFALAAIVLTHAAIDRWRLARFVVFAKNYLAPPDDWWPWDACDWSGYPKLRAASVPWMTTWLYIIADNVMHVLINGAALKRL